MFLYSYRSVRVGVYSSSIHKLYIYKHSIYYIDTYWIDSIDGDTESPHTSRGMMICVTIYWVLVSHKMSLIQKKKQMGHEWCVI